MNSERYRQITQVLADVLDCRASDRAAVLDRLCGQDDALRDAVELLLAREEATRPFLERPVIALDEHRLADDDAPIGQRLGPYRLSAEIGRGGMGAVYLAERNDDEYQGRVAIKLIKRGMDTDAIQRRFRRERQILANLEHHYIARLLDGGTTADGRPYLVMEYVAGLRIDRYADERRRDEAGRIAIFLKVCEAVQYAHEHHVVHGDIKPANMLVTDAGIPKLLDFGIARLLDPSSSDAQTGGPRVMTPDYASPEQLRGEPIAAASDVYSLGAVLRELIVGTPHPSSPDLGGRLNGDLGTVLAMAQRDDPGRRYQSVRDLADDLTRYLDGRPVKARKDTLVYRAGAFVRRHRAAVLAASAIAIGCLLLGMFLTTLATRPVRPRSLAVLPFSTVDADEPSRILSEGVTDGLIRSFSDVPLLTVSPRDSVFHLGRPVAPLEAARTLHADTVLMGKLTTSPDRLSIEASLFDAARGRVIWSHVYDAPSSDLLVVQSRILSDVSQELGVKSASGNQPGVSSRYTTNVAAYREYLIGRYFWDLRTIDAYQRAIEHFQAALAIDPQYALAYSGLADCHALAALYGLPPGQEFAAAEAAAREALRLDPSLGEAHAPLALKAWLVDWDWEKANREFLTAILLQPRYPTAHHWYGLFLGEMARFDEAETQTQLALDLDPTSPAIWADSGRVYFWARRYDESRARYRQAFEMGASPVFLRDAMDLYEQIDPAEYLRTLVRLDWCSEEQVDIYRTQGRHAFWRMYVALLPHRTPTLDDIEVFVRAGDNDRAFASLNLSIDEHSDHRISQLRVDPVLYPLRSDPRFAALLKRMRLD